LPCLKKAVFCSIITTIWRSTY